MEVGADARVRDCVSCCKPTKLVSPAHATPAAGHLLEANQLMMREIADNLWIGDQASCPGQCALDSNWACCHSVKDPCHRKQLGYTTKGAPKDSPNYLVMQKGHDLYLNLVDADDPAFIAKEIVDAAITFIQANILGNRQVLLHCNEGRSRAPGLAMLYLLKTKTRLKVPPGERSEVPLWTLPSAAVAFQEWALFVHDTHMRPGMAGFIQQHYKEYAA